MFDSKHSQPDMDLKVPENPSMSRLQTSSFSCSIQKKCPRKTYLPDVKVDFGIEVHEQCGRDESKDKALAPIDIDGVVWMDSQFCNVQLDVGDIDTIFLKQKRKICNGNVALYIFIHTPHFTGF